MFHVGLTGASWLVRMCSVGSSGDKQATHGGYGSRK